MDEGGGDETAVNIFSEPTMSRRLAIFISDSVIHHLRKSRTQLKSSLSLRVTTDISHIRYATQVSRLYIKNADAAV